MSVRLNSVFLHDFVDQLRTETTDYRNPYLNHFEKLENAFIERDSENIIDRFYVSGSIKKKSTLYYKFDADIIIFFNCENGYEEYKEKMKNASFFDYIKKIVAAEYSAPEVQFKCTKNALQLKIDELDFDILPALNMLQEKDKKRDWSRFFIQHDRIASLCHSQADKAPTAMFKLKTSYQELNDYFVMKQDGFTQSLILLCKHWCRTHLNFKDLNFPGKLSMIELIAIHVGSTFPRPKCLTNAFLNFLRICGEIQNCRIQFPPMYEPGRFTPEIDPQRHLLDPVNPYNNRLKIANEQQLNYISTTANATKNKLLYCLANSDSPKARTQLDEIFGFIKHAPDLYFNCEMFESTMGRLQRDDPELCDDLAAIGIGENKEN